MSTAPNRPTTILLESDANPDVIASLGTPADLLVPLVVDVDGTLLKTDLLHEATLRLAATQPAALLALPIWLTRGKAHLKSELASRVGLDPLVPMREEVLTLIRTVQAQGRRVFLASASDKRYVDAVAAIVGGIEGVFATDKSVNLTGAAKASALVAAFGHRGFDYVGDSRVDLEVWTQARRSLVVSRGPRFERLVRSVIPDAQVVAEHRSAWPAMLKGMRLHQWAKNLLIFVPMLLAHAFDTSSLASAVLAFFAFSCAASSAYVLNDLLDLPSDRRHVSKRRRPFAAGSVRLDHALMLSAGLALTAWTVAVLINAAFASLLALYYGLTMGYSLTLKRRMLVDVVVLGGLYVLRVLAGAAAIGTPESNWLLLFCFFQFLALAIAKRIAELQSRAGETPALQGRGYEHLDLAMLMPLGAGAAFGAPLVLGLYVASPEVLARYGHPSVLWLVAPILLYWTSRILMVANRGRLHDDPVVFALKDRVSWMCGALIAALMWMAR